MQDTLARKLRVLRAERQLTVREAAALTGVDPGTISKIERGVRHPHDITLSRLAQGYDVPVEELLEEEPVPLAETPREAGRSARRSWEYIVELEARIGTLEGELKRCTEHAAELEAANIAIVDENHQLLAELAQRKD